MRPADSTFQGNFVEAMLLVTVETPLATVSVCMPSIFQLTRRALYHGIPSLFSTQDPSKPVGGGHGEHIGGLGSPVDSDVMHIKRLVDPGDKTSQERLVHITTVSRTSNMMSEEIPLDDIRVRDEVEVQSTQRRDIFEGNSAV